jgi:hypothetical protein
VVCGANTPSSTSNNNHTTTIKDEWSWSALFGRLAATLTELELVRHVRDPYQIATPTALFPHAPLDPTHGDLVFFFFALLSYYVDGVTHFFFSHFCM